MVFHSPSNSCHQVWTLRRSQWKRCRRDRRVHAEALWVPRGGASATFSWGLRVLDHDDDDDDNQGYRRVMCILFYLAVICHLLLFLLALLSCPMSYYHHSYSKINVLNVSTGAENPSVAVPRLAGNDPTEIEPLQAEDSTANILGSARDLPMVGTGKTCDPRTGNMWPFFIGIGYTKNNVFFLRNMIHYDPLDTWINWINDRLDQQWHVNVMQICFDHFRMMFSSKVSSYGILWSKLHFDHLVIWIPSVPSPPGPRVAARTGTIHQRLHGEKEGVTKLRSVVA